MSTEDNMKDEGRSALDSFWDIGSLIPSKKSARQGFSRRNTDAVEISLPPPAENGKNGAENPPHDASIPAESERQNGRTPRSEILFSYEPQGSLVRSVTVSSWPYSYHFYDKFLSDAKRLLDAPGPECEYVPFFSYIPQYSGLSPKQLDYYLYFRASVKRGEFPRADISYVLLMVYEIINLPEKIAPEAGLSLMVDLWLGYRGSCPALDKYLSEWVCDYCLIHRLPPPSERLDPILGKFLDKASFKEFYLSGAREESDSGNAYLARSLVRFASSYNWRESRVLDSENRKLFKKHIPEALEYLLQNTGKDILSGAKPMPRRISRDAFAASLCSCNAKRKLDIEYLSFERSLELRAVVTAAVKYSENRIRAACGIKSRLKVPQLPKGISVPLTEYFDRELPTASAGSSVKRAEKDRSREYERFYEPETRGFNASRASEIEKDSWLVAKMLEVPEEPELTASGPIPERVPKADETPKAEKAPAEASGWESFAAALSREELEFLRRISRGEDPKSAASVCPGALPEALADRINSAAADHTGDILIEETDEGLALIDEYREEVTPYIGADR